MPHFPMIQHEVCLRLVKCGMLRPGSWSRPGGGSPGRVSIGAPGSRSRFVVERWRAEWGVESRFGGSRHAGRRLERTVQPRHGHNGGAEPFMSRRRRRPAGPVPGSVRRVLPGTGDVHGLDRNRGDPSAWPGSGTDRTYKPMVKSFGGQREAEGVVVSLIGVQHNAPGGKGPHFDHAWGEGKRQGMTGTPGSNNLDGWPLVGGVA